MYLYGGDTSLFILAFANQVISFKIPATFSKHGAISTLSNLIIPAASSILVNHSYALFVSDMSSPRTSLQIHRLNRQQISASDFLSY